ncbi:hypothetical protein MAH1_36960 [Sessilibacter sp. MAH1]
MKAKEWFERGKQQNDPLNAFSNYWRGFNHLFAGNKNERDLISLYLSSSISEETAEVILSSNVEEAQVLLRTPVLDMRGNGRNTRRYQKQFHSQNTAIEKLVALFMIIYQVRCNLEHGQKSPNRDRDIQLCQASCPFIAAIIENA